MGQTLTVTIPDDLADELQSAVSEGRVESADAFVEVVLREALKPETVAGIPVEELARLAQEAIDDPEPSLSSEEMRAHLDQMYADARAAKAK